MKPVSGGGRAGPGIHGSAPGHYTTFHFLRRKGGHDGHGGGTVGLTVSPTGARFLRVRHCSRFIWSAPVFKEQAPPDVSPKDNPEPTQLGPGARRLSELLRPSPWGSARVPPASPLPAPAHALCSLAPTGPVSRVPPSPESRLWEGGESARDPHMQIKK